MAGSVETQRLRLERWDRREHAPGLAAVNADPEVMRFITGGATMTRVESQVQSDRIAEHWRTYGFGLWAVIEAASGQMIGFAGLSHPLWLPGWERTVEVGWRFAREAWGNGYATEAGQAGLAYGFGRVGLSEIVSLIHPDNERSLAVAGRLGLELTERIPHPRRPHDLTVHVARPPHAALEPGVGQPQAE
jgi:RimJ/RimL family protein N-acetyltransferase